MTDASRTTDSALAELARTARLLVALDFDGTVSSHVDDPMAARMLPAARTVLTLLAELEDTTVALVSGRSLTDLRLIAEHHDDAPFLLAGSHGAEYWYPGSGAVESDPDPENETLRDELQTEAEALVAGLPGVWIEPKRFGLGVHTRVASDADGARADELVDDLLRARAPQWRRRTGKKILEFAFRQEGKDRAIAELRDRLDATAVLFAGDDVTDEDALRSLGEHDLGVRVGPGETAAAVTVPDIDGLVALLDRLARLRGASARE